MAGKSDPMAWRPPNASARAKAMWDQNPFARFQDLIYLTDAKADEYTRLLFESFSLPELEAAVFRMIDIRPIVRQRAMLDEFVVGRLAKSVIRANWQRIDWRLRRPAHILGLLKATDPAKHAVLDTPRGRTWLNWTCYELDSLLAYYAQPRGHVPMAPPPGRNPLTPIPQEALEAGRQG